MKTTRRMLTLLLALALMLSLAITVSAQENGDHAPYLSVRDLWNDGEGWYESEDAELRQGEDGTAALTWGWRIYYLNTWDEDAGAYVSQPVIPSEDHENLTVTLVSEDPEEGYIREGEANADYFVKVHAANSMDYQETELYYMLGGEKISLPFYIYEWWSGFYTSQEYSADTVILNGDFRTDVMAEENALYYIVHNKYERVDSFEYSVVQWDENGNEVVKNGLVDMYEIGNGIYKFTVDPDFVRMTTGNWQNFNLRVRAELAGGDIVDERNIFVNPSGSHDNIAARLNINGAEYMFYEDSDVVGTWEPQFDENGDPLMNEWGGHIHYWTKTQLPEGVSYDLGSNTLTLNNARLESLGANYYWANYDENGNIIVREDGTLEEGYELPSDTLTIKLKGQNEIVSGYNMPMNFGGELNVTINGTGSLLVKAVNSTENTRTEYYWNGESDVETQVYHHFDALCVNDGCTLTIAGNAKVTAEIEGEAYETIYDENGPTDRYENAFLSAVRVNEGELILKDNAALTTVLPEAARDNGPAIDGMYSGGYRGVENVRNLTIQDNASLTTSSLHVPNGWQWNEETQQDEIVWNGTYNQTGGTVTITGLGQYGINLNEEGEPIPHFHYSGLWTDFGEINISGGTLNVTAEPTAEEAATSAWAQAIGVGEGKLNISGGTVNANVSYGQAIGVPCGDVTVSGGTVNLNTYDGSGITTGEWGDDPNDDYNPDGTVVINGGIVNINSSDSGYPTPAIELLDTTKSFVISDGELNIENGMFDVYGTLDIRGGKVTLEAETSQNYYAAFGTFDPEAIWNMSGGELIIDTTNYAFGIMNHGTFRQTGGSITVDVAATEKWRGDYTETDDEGKITYWPEVIGIISYGNTGLSGGTVTVNSADIGFLQDMMWDASLDDDGNVVTALVENSKLEVSGDAVLNATGRTVGIQVVGVADISGGSVNAVAENPVEGDMAFAFRAMSNAGTYDYWTEDGERIPYEMDNSASVSITGGSHSFIAPTTSIRGTGFFSVFCPVTIENATVKAVGGRSVFDVAGSEEGNISGSWYIISLKSGEELQLLSETNTIEENGESFTETVHFLEEDNVLGNEENTYDFATEVLILPDNKCGEGAYWEIEDGVLTISGEGAMYDYQPVDFEQGLSNAPWMPVKQVVTEVVVEEGITHVGAWSFAWLENATEISYPASMTSLGEASVVQATKLAGYTVASGNKRYASPDGISIVDLKESRLHTVAMAAPGKTYTVPEGVTVIGGMAMTLCGFEEVIVPEGVTEIQVAVFEGNANLKTITIPKSVKSMGDAVFVGCDKVTVTVYCGTVGETYVKANELDSEIIHEYADATCTAPKTCENCDATEGAALGHKWGEWETGDDGVKTRICSVCKESETSEPKPTEPEETKPVELAFVDVPEDAYYYLPVAWAVEKKITTGVDATHFAPESTCTRAHVVTFLWRANGSPAPVSSNNPFTDVPAGEWYTNAVLWAVENGITTGTSATTFSPDDGCTRGQVATFLHRAQKKPAYSSENPFTDVISGEYYYDAVLWAVENGITNGMGDGIFAPNVTCTRSQIVTFLYRALSGK